jgi:hypothetical protein
MYAFSSSENRMQSKSTWGRKHTQAAKRVLKSIISGATMDSACDQRSARKICTSRYRFRFVGNICKRRSKPSTWQNGSHISVAIFLNFGTKIAYCYCFRTMIILFARCMRIFCVARAKSTSYRDTRTVRYEYTPTAHLCSIYSQSAWRFY